MVNAGTEKSNALLDPLENRGVAFSLEERKRLGLTGRLPSAVFTLDQQAERAYAQLHQQPDDLAENVYLEQLHDRNEILYYRLLADHLDELLPVVYDPTVGQAVKLYSHEYRRPRGVYLSIDRPDDDSRDPALFDLLVDPDAMVGDPERDLGSRSSKSAWS